MIGFGFWFGLDEKWREVFLANSSKPVTSRHSNENRSDPIKTRNYYQLTRSAGRRVRVSCHWFWFDFWLDEKVARVFQAHLIAQQRKTRFISTIKWKTSKTALNKHRSDKYILFMTASFPKRPKTVLDIYYLIHTVFQINTDRPRPAENVFIFFSTVLLWKQLWLRPLSSNLTHACVCHFGRKKR